MDEKHGVFGYPLFEAVDVGVDVEGEVLDKQATTETGSYTSNQASKRTVHTYILGKEQS